MGPSSSASKQTKQKLPTLRPLFVEDDTNSKSNMTIAQGLEKKKDHLKKYNATIEIIEYDDGWHKSLEGLPVVWIDGQFTDIISSSKNSNDAGNNTTKSISTKTDSNSSSNSYYVTPQLLEQEYDNLARMAALNQFHYEKLTSTYWIELIESFLLTPEEIKLHSNSSWLAVPRDSQLRISSPNGTSDEELRHPYHYDTSNGGNNDNNNDEEERNNENNDHSIPPSPLPHPSMMIGWTILVWEIFISLKVVGIALIVIVVRRFEQQQTRTQTQNQNQQQQNHEQ